MNGNADKQKIAVRDLFGFLSKEQAENHEVRKRKEEVDIRVILVFFHKECCPVKTQNNRIIQKTLHFSGCALCNAAIHQMRQTT